MCSGIRLLEEFRLKMVQRVNVDGASITQVSAEFCVSRKTIYKWLRKYDQDGLRGLTHCPGGRPAGAFRTTGSVCGLVLWLKNEHHDFGPKKIQHLMTEQLSAEEVPSLSTVARVLRHAGLTDRRGRGRRRAVPSDAGLAKSEACNGLWTLDFKGNWVTRDGLKCSPLTVQEARDARGSPV